MACLIFFYFFFVKFPLINDFKQIKTTKRFFGSFSKNKQRKEEQDYNVNLKNLENRQKNGVLSFQTEPN